MLSAPVRPFGPSQEPTKEEWLRPRKPDGSPYVRGGHFGWDHQAADRDARAVVSGPVRHVNFGDFLGEHQFVIVAPDGSGWFYAHTSNRLPSGYRIEAGEVAAYISDEGVPGAVHLHIEFLKRWNDWYSSTYTTELHDCWEEINMALSTEDWDRLEKMLDVRVQATVAAILDGTNNPNTPIIPDTAGWNARLAFNVRRAIETAGGGVDPTVIEAALKNVLKGGVG